MRSLRPSFSEAGARAACPSHPGRVPEGRAASPPRLHAAADGFSLLELTIVVSLIGLLAVMAMPAVMRQRMRTQDSSFLNDLRLLSAGFEQYAIENGGFPPGAQPGVEPAGFAPYRPGRIRWESETRVGGRWQWDRAEHRGTNVYGVYAGLSVVSPKRTSWQMTEIDAKIDDGNIDGGAFRRRPGGYIYILEE